MYDIQQSKGKWTASQILLRNNELNGPKSHTKAPLEAQFRGDQDPILEKSAINMIHMSSKGSLISLVFKGFHGFFDFQLCMIEK